MPTILLVATGGAIGSVLRFLVGNWGAALAGSAFPWPTILINVAGSALIGFAGASAASASARAFLMVGLCGGFTTFSSFSLQTLDLLRSGRPAAAFGNVIASVALCLLGVAAGHWAATAGAAAR